MAVSSVTTAPRTAPPSAASTYTTQPTPYNVTMEPDRAFDEEDPKILTQLAPLVEQFMSDSEYEDIETDRWWVPLLAGALAGVGEHWVMYPVDTIKTRMMAIAPPPRYSSWLTAASHIRKEEGMFRMWRGGAVVWCGALPAHALYFAAYEKGKEVSGRYMGHNSPWSHLLSGAGAALVHDAVMTPTDAIKQRMQVYQSTHSSNWSCARSMYKEGLGTFYRSYGTQICMNVPQQMLMFGIYEKLKAVVNPAGEYNPGAHVLCGGLAGGAAALITTPLDVCKTFLNTQTLNSKDGQITRGLWNGRSAVYKAGGFSAFFKGCVPRTVIAIPSTGICWGVYETCKHLFKS